jgi:ABC-2 type transport system ATP-binding protein
MIDVRNVSKSYGQIQALRDVSFHVDDGEIIGLLGPNGAGKTTTMKILTGYLQPDEGQVSVDGLDVLTDTLRVQQRIGYLPENAPLYPEMSVQDYLKMMAELRQIPEDEQPAPLPPEEGAAAEAPAGRMVSAGPALSAAIRATGLQEHMTRPIGHLSKGFRQRVGLAQAILHKPKLLILDEPTIGLDPTQIVEVRGLIRRLARNSTILLSTHILSEVESTCDRVIILLNGQIKADARLADLAGTADVVLELCEGAEGVVADLQGLPGVRAVEESLTPDGSGYRIRGGDGEDLRPAVYDLARARNWRLRELRRDVRTLESVFNELVAEATTEESLSRAPEDEDLASMGGER